MNVLNDKGELIEEFLNRALKESMDNSIYDANTANIENDELNYFLVNYALNNVYRKLDGMIVLLLLWNSKVCDFLGKNFNLAKSVLNSNLKRLRDKPELLNLMDESFVEQQQLGIIEAVPDVDLFMQENPNFSFLAHMGVFKLKRETTKCRVVFLSNICEKSNSQALTVSHNQAIHPGPCLNQKIVSALLHARFGSKIFIFDIGKAFNQIELNSIDQSKLLFLWFRNVKKNDFSIVAYKNIRLSFGLRCSPTLLMLAFYKILILDNDHDDLCMIDIKKIMYQLIYMDNGAYCTDNFDKLKFAYDKLNEIFGPYKMPVQQIACNDSNLQNEIDEGKEPTANEVKLLGLQWYRDSDCISTKPIFLDCKANTKRLILQTIASNYDLFNINAPMLNRARLFMQQLQSISLPWDENLESEKLKEWKLICKQANDTPILKIKRCVGERYNRYELIACVDANKSIIGAVIYLLNLDTNEISFIIGKNKLIGNQLKDKSVPCLELQAIVLGTQTLIDLKYELCGEICVSPLNIVSLRLYSDSLVALSWLNSYFTKLDKMNNKSVFIMNRLNTVDKLCNKESVHFIYINGSSNPADCITRCLSYKMLMKSNYFTGPEISNCLQMSKEDIMNFKVPNPKINSSEVNYLVNTTQVKTFNTEHLIPVDKFSSFEKLVRVHAEVLRSVDKFKGLINDVNVNKDYLDLARKEIISKEQRIEFTEIFEYFESKDKSLKNIPNLVLQLNIFLDQENLLRVKSKLEKWDCAQRNFFPILLPKNSKMTEMIIFELHIKFSHAGCYSLLGELRKRFWIIHYFSLVKKIVRSCVICKRYNSRSIKLNQNSYRDFRIQPNFIPFSYVYFDYFGPYYVMINDTKCKIYILCITCMFTRAVNLKVSLDMTVSEFLRSFMLHIFEYGLPQFVVSDLGSQLVAGSNLIIDYLNDPETQNYFQSNGIRPIQFDHYFKGCSSLGSLVEICVKMSKLLIHKSIKNFVLNFRDFEFTICQTVHFINRRPVAFREALRDNSVWDSVPTAITPERLIHGYDLISVNIIPDHQINPDLDEEFVPLTATQQVRHIDKKLCKVRTNLRRVYHSEFLSTLAVQATDKPGRYKPVVHKELKVGDLVLINDVHTKPLNYPLGVITETFYNDLGEVTKAIVKKGRTGEITKRHVSNLIPYLQLDRNSDQHKAVNEDNNEIKTVNMRAQRKAAEKSRSATQKLYDYDLC